MRLISIEIEQRMKFLGYYQIIGGIVGLYIVISSFISVQALGGLQFLFYTIAIGLFAFSIYTGNLLRTENIKGIKYSNWVQISQVLQVSFISFTFGYSSGIEFSFGFHLLEVFRPDFSLNISNFQIYYSSRNNVEFFMFINFVPLFLIYLLGDLEKKIEERKRLLSENE
jgi:hypothetical protein